MDESLEENKSVIKENSFYKIVEVNPDITQLPTEVDTSYKEEVDEKLSNMESKYEDLLQKTKDQYQNQMNKMTEEFAKFRNNIAQQVSRMAMVSTSAGGGAVNILDMDDVDKTNIQDGYTLSYNSNTRKFEFLDLSTVGSSATFNLMESEVFTITQNDLDNSYMDLSFSADSNYYDISEFHINGLVNIHQTNYTFTTSSRIDISNLSLEIGDIVRIVYIKS